MGWIVIVFTFEKIVFVFPLFIAFGFSVCLANTIIFSIFGYQCFDKVYIVWSSNEKQWKCGCNVTAVSARWIMWNWVYVNLPSPKYVANDWKYERRININLYWKQPIYSPLFTIKTSHCRSPTPTITVILHPFIDMYTCYIWWNCFI